MIAEGWTMGLNAGSSVPDGGCSFTFMTCGQEGRMGTAGSGFSSPCPEEPGPACPPDCPLGGLGLFLGSLLP